MKPFRVVIGLILTCGVIYLLAVGALYAQQRSFIYPGVTATVVPARELGSGWSDVSLQTADGLTLRAAYRPARHGKPTLVFFHGNGDSLRGAAAATGALAAQGYGVLLPEYRGYGGNPGTPDEAGLYRDGRAALDWLAEHGIAPEHIVLVGNSLGSGVATQLAGERPVRALVIISGFTSLPAAAARHIRLFPVRWLIRDRYENLAKVPALMMPVLILHGDGDTLIPVEHDIALAGAARQPTLVRVPGVGHELAYQPAAQTEIARWLADR